MWQVKLSLRSVYKALLVASLVVFVVSIFLPWLSESDQFPFLIYPPFHIHGQFWPFQAVLNMPSGDNVAGSFTLRFHEFWFARDFVNPNSGIMDLYPHLWRRPDIYRGWMFVFVFQMLGVAAGILSIVKERVKGHPLPLVCAVVASSATLILGYYQFLQHSGWEGLGWLKVDVEIGFYFASISLILWLISWLIVARGLTVRR